MRARCHRNNGDVKLFVHSLLWTCSQATNRLMNGAASALRDIPSAVYDTARGRSPRAVS